ncbi:hypothetical protein ACOSQ2_017078 [Xanthoceras sorbifolium]
MVSYEVSIGLILIVRLVSAFGSAKAIARMADFGQKAFSDQGPGHKGLGTIQVRRTPEAAKRNRKGGAELTDKCLFSL